ncbi:Uncharacterised protein [Candidatus Norongarragalina meridionalis]|nr:Uncharacterised protein [Candidatus Norongarragalina meridionalis]
MDEAVEKLKRIRAELGNKGRVESNSELMDALGMRGEERRKLQVRRVRSASGICVVAIMTRPYECPGKCIYCPTSEKAPKSYTGEEPAALRARQNDFDAARQVTSRIEQLEAIGHEPSKCELIVMGGTFNYQPSTYRNAFMKKAFEAFNERKSATLSAAQKANERANHRVIGLTFETRPDWCSEKQVKEFLAYGATRIELGVQTLDEEVLRRVNRGHDVAAVAEATRICKDAFLKVGYHMMPGLFADAKKDAEIFRKLFHDERFKPDMLKIYPCLVLEGTPLYDLWKKGKFKPYSVEEAAKALAECKRFVPPYCRVMRIDRDIPTKLIVDGVKKSNLRELVKREMDCRGLKCACIRCREIGLRGEKIGKTAMNRLDYGASGGKETFLSLDDEKNGFLVGYLRLRERADGVVGVRELRVLGEQTPVGEETRMAQHRGLGARLLDEAERIAHDGGARELLVLSGIGARPYYRKQGYKLREGYMVKGLP